jgi:hypothetical protein
MSSSSEYLTVLRSVINNLQEATRDPRLPDLSVEEIAYWFHNVRCEDIQAALLDIDESILIAHSSRDSVVGAVKYC